MGKPNNLKVIGCKTIKGYEQDIKNRLRSPVPKNLEDTKRVIRVNRGRTDNTMSKIKAGGELECS